MTTVHSHLGEVDEAVASGTRALQIANRLGDLDLRILASAYLGQAHYFRGEYERAAKLAIENIAALPADRVGEYFGGLIAVSVFDRVYLVRSLVELGRFAEAARYPAEAIQLAEATQHASTIGLAHLAAPTLHLLKGEWDQARAAVEQLIAVFRFRSENVAILLPESIGASAYVMAQVGERSRALDFIREGEQVLQSTKGVVHRRAHVWLGRANFLLGRLDEAQSLGEEVARSLRSAGFAAYAGHLLGDIATHPDRFDAETGEAHYRKALALAEPRGMRPLVAHCHLGLGRLYRRTEKNQQALEHLTTATKMYREMGMTYWPENVEREIEEFENDV
jgi:tetratricopeptide (TPR) repeat protein